MCLYHRNKKMKIDVIWICVWLVVLHVVFVVFDDVFELSVVAMM